MTDDEILCVIETRLRAELAQGQEPVAEADHGVLNWIDGQQFQEHRQLYTAPPVPQDCVLVPTDEALRFVRQFMAWYPSCAQLLDGWHADGTSWTEWDTSVRTGLRTLGGVAEKIFPICPRCGYGECKNASGERYCEHMMKFYAVNVPVQNAVSQDCNWSQDGDGGPWATGCGHYFDLNEGTPSDNKMAWCCYCGGAVKDEPYCDEEDEESPKAAT